MQSESLNTHLASSSDPIDTLRAFLTEHRPNIYHADRISQMTYKNLVYAKRLIEAENKLEGK